MSAQVISEDPIAAFTAAIKASDAALAREFLTRHPSVKSRLDDPLPGLAFDAPAIVAAVNHGNRELIDVLLAAGANINARSHWWAGGFGVLDSATPELADYLISRGATIDIHAASRLGKVDRVRDLLAADPQLVHARGGDGQLPLHFAATVEIAELLLDHGAEIDARDIDHESTAAQYLVALRQHQAWLAPSRHQVVRFLISRGAQTDILMASAVGDLALVERILNDDPETVRTTVSERWFPKRDPRAGGSIYIYGFGISRSPHSIAHQFGHTAVFDLLMQRSPVWLRLVNAAEICDEPRFQSILAAHPSVFQKLSPKAARYLVGPAVRNNTRAVQLLVEHGWPTNAVLDNGQTALHYAAWHGNLAMVQTLLAHNAPVNVFENEHGGSPLAWALHGSLNSWERTKGDYPVVTRALLAAGARIPQSEGSLAASEEVLAILSTSGR